ncbi:MAG: hypothetical protein ACI9S8_002880 [Chlamydiales bacterium]|jgi:hypothetical protein
MGDYQNGENPVIGGHTLGWAPEVIAIADIIYHVLGEIKHIGTAKLTATVFKSHIKKVNEEKAPWWNERANRLYHVMKRQITMIPHGYFFNKPSLLMFCSKV